MPSPLASSIMVSTTWHYWQARYKMAAALAFSSLLAKVDRRPCPVVASEALMSRTSASFLTSSLRPFLSMYSWILTVMAMVFFDEADFLPGRAAFGLSPWPFGRLIVTCATCWSVLVVPLHHDP